MNKLSLEMIDHAARFLEGRALLTPCEYSAKLSKCAGVPVYLKLENLQRTGSFKIRGAYFRLANLSEKEAKSGIVTCSAGNHGKACALVAQELGISCSVFVPQNADEAKLEGIRSYGATLIRSDQIGFDETEKKAKEFARQTGKVFISPFDHDEIMAANGGTIAKEILSERPDVRTFIVPVGGGGISAGLSYYVKELLPEAKIVGCQHAGSSALLQSIKENRAITTLPAIDTIAGGLEGGIGATCFEILQRRIDEVVTLSEDEIKKSVIWLLENCQYLVEGSAAVAVAALLFQKVKQLTTPTVLVLTGRNMSLATLKSILDLD